MGEIVIETLFDLLEMFALSTLASLIIFIIGTIAMSLEKRKPIVKGIQELVGDLKDRKGQTLAIIMFFGLGAMTLVDIPARVIYGIIYLFVVFKYVINK